MEEAYINLVNAIILQAFKDYHWAMRKLRMPLLHPTASTPVLPPAATVPAVISSWSPRK